jgi:hypothetical protein
MFFAEFVFEPAEGSLALDRPASPRPARSSVIPPTKSAMSWNQIQDGSGSMTTRCTRFGTWGCYPGDEGITGGGP